MPRYAIVIPTYNSAATLEALLASLQRQEYADFHTIVVDDASVDDTPAVAARYKTDYVRIEKRQGPANARNRGAALTQSEWLVFADADTVFAPDTLAAIDRMLDLSGADALVGSYAGRPANSGFVPRYKALWERCVIDEGIRLNEQGYQQINAWAPRPGVVRRAAFDQIGGFNTGFLGADLEDVDLGHRLSDAGYLIAFAPGIRILHNYPATARAELKAFARRAALWMRMFKSRTKFDSTGESSPRQALAHLTGFGAFLLLPAAVVWPYARPPLALALLAYMIFNIPFIRAAFRQERPLHALFFVLYCWLHTIVLGFAALYGLLKPAMGEPARGQ
ncbi:MAG TPA: glycosyltransferase [Candidatus Bathyarchaeia archaeon]|nr:glycosyltransferase [Candidatus Bathyarchaeia archaeon]